MKPGGIVGVADHAGRAGDTRAIVEQFHRIDPVVVKADFAAAGFVLEAKSALLANPADDRSMLVFDPRCAARPTVSCTISASRAERYERSDCAASYRVVRRSGAMTLVIGTAGWSIPSKEAARFGGGGTALARYATRFAGVEINSSFHRAHRAATWARWAASVPPAFRFAVKLPKTITHQRKLVDCADLVAGFAHEVSGLGDKLAVVLVQLPPKLGFEAALAEALFAQLAALIPVQLACEPRHPSWFGEESDALLDRLRVARVAADPAITPAAARPGGWRGFSYWRLHGSPAMYRSSYDDGRLDGYAKRIQAEREHARGVWCMFDNTASAAATGDALTLTTRLCEGVYIASPRP